MAERESPAMVDATAGCDDDGESGSEEDELDEQTMEAISSGSLPMSSETCIALNMVYQELLQSFMRHVEACLAQNREKQRALEQELQSYSGEGCTKKQESKVPVLLYLPPYFRDSAGLASMKNADAIAKSGEFNLLVDQPKKWSSLEKEKLRESVERSVVQLEQAPLSNKRHFLVEQMNASNDPNELTKFSIQIREVDRKLEILKAKTDLTLAPDKAFECIDWNQVSASEFKGTRTANECRLAWKGEVNPRVNQNPTWTASELQELSRLAESHQYTDWKTIASELNTGRTAFQCFEKHQSDVCRAGRGKWTSEDDMKLREAVEYCRQGDFIPWEQVADMVEGRTRTQCATRWTRSLFPGHKRGSWTEEEDLLLLAAVEKYGAKDWTKVAEFVPGRTEGQCRERWSTSMVSGQRVGQWTPQEDSLLLEGVKQFGSGAWSKICHLLPGRTPPACKVRYRKMHKRATGTAATAASHSTQALVHGHIRRCQERKRRIAALYTKLVGHPPVLKGYEKGVDDVLAELPPEIRVMFREKLEAVKLSNQIQLPNKCGDGSRGSSKRARLENDQLHAILSDKEAMPASVQTSDKPVNELADLVKSSQALLPPTRGTVRSIRNLLSMHGADCLIESSTLGDRASHSEIIRGGNEDESLTGTFTADASFTLLRDTFRQLFLWPAVLATMAKEKA